MAHSSHTWGKDGFCIQCINVHRTDLYGRAQQPCRNQLKIQPDCNDAKAAKRKTFNQAKTEHSKEHNVDDLKEMRREDFLGDFK